MEVSHEAMMFGPLQWRSRSDINHGEPGTEPTVSSDSVNEPFTAKDLNSRDTFSWLGFYDCKHMYTCKCNTLSEDGRGPDNWSLVEFVATHPLCSFGADISWDIYEPTLTSV